MTELILYCQRCEQEEKSLLLKGQLLTLESKVEAPVGAATRGDDKGSETTAAEENGAESGGETIQEHDLL